MSTSPRPATVRTSPRRRPSTTAIDIGGTFTDVMSVDADGGFTTAKLPTTPANLDACFRAGLAAVGGDNGVVSCGASEVLYSTTLAINALLQHRLPRIGLIVTAGFREILETARLPLSESAEPGAPAPRLVALEWVRELSARIDAQGRERAPLDEAEVARIAGWYREAGIAVVAVSLLHSYLDAAHERAVAAVFARVAPAIHVVLSCAVLPELREYERTVAACLNACLIPVLGAHIEALQDGGRSAPLLLMKSPADSAAHGPPVTNP